MARKNITKPEKRPGPVPFVKEIMAARAPQMLATTRLSVLFRVPVYVVEGYIRKWMRDNPTEAGIVTWKRKLKKGGMKTAYRVPLEVAEQMRLKYRIPGKPLVKVAAAQEEPLHEAVGM